MGHMMNGRWVDDDRITADVRGAFVRADSQFRSWVTDDGSAGPSGSDGFKAEPGRYHLFVSYNCPWAHRTIIFRKLKKLEDEVSMSLADRPKTAGWAYSETIDDFQPEKDGVFRLHQVYAAADANYTGKVTVPTLWDRERRTIVNATAPPANTTAACPPTSLAMAATRASRALPILFPRKHSRT